MIIFLFYSLVFPPKINNSNITETLFFLNPSPVIAKPADVRILPVLSSENNKNNGCLLKEKLCLKKSRSL